MHSRDRVENSIAAVLHYNHELFSLEFLRVYTYNITFVQAECRVY